MFRNTQLLRRSSQIGGNEGEQDSRPVAILAHPYEAEAGILVPVLARFGFRVLEARDGAAALDLAHRHVTSLVVASSDQTGEGPRGSRDVNDIMSLTDDEG